MMSFGREETSDGEKPPRLKTKHAVAIGYEFATPSYAPPSMYRSLSLSWFASGRPSMRSRISPSLNRMIGSGLHPELARDVRVLLSVSIFTRDTLSRSTAAASCGNTCLLRSWHGPHHVA